MLQVDSNCRDGGGYVVAVVVYGYGFGVVVVGGKGDDDGAVAA